MEKRTHKSVRDFISCFKSGIYNDKDVDTQIKAGWFDWFCEDSDLQAKTAEIGSLISKITESGKIDLDHWYIWFKNNCPLKGPLYDEICFSSIDTEEIILIVQIGCKWNKTKFVVLGKVQEKVFFPSKLLYETNSTEELINWLNEA